MFRDISDLRGKLRLESSEWAQSVYQPNSHKADCVQRVRSEVSIFLDRRLFHRLWIRQEIAAADNLILQCGQLTVDFPSFVLGLELLSSKIAILASH